MPIADVGVRGGSGAGETDPTKHQTWSLTASSPITLSGTSQLTLWSAIKDFSPTKRGVVDAFLLDCDSSGSSCTTIDSVTLDEASWAGGSTTWVSKTLDFGSVDYTVAAERLLRVKIVVGAAADDHMWFAYDTTDYPSRLDHWLTGVIVAQRPVKRASRRSLNAAMPSTRSADVVASDW